MREADLATSVTAAVTVVAVDTPTLGDRSYLVHDERVAFVVDPQRDIDRILILAAAAGVVITHVFETHIHNDYVTGGQVLAADTGAAYVVNAADEVAFARTAVSDGDEIAVGDRMRIAVVATPGHTHTHLAYTLVEHDVPVAVFTGGSLLYGAVGRPDLLGPDHTETLAHDQYASAQRLDAMLPPATRVFPTHGFGSFCAAGPTPADVPGAVSTIGGERLNNPVLNTDESTFIAGLLADLDAFPAYYAHMALINATGSDPIDLTRPTRAEAAELYRRITAGEWVVDLRDRTAYAAGHVPGTLNIGIDGSFATYLGWLIPWGTPLTLLGDSETQVTAAQRELVRIGIDRLAAYAAGDPSTWTDRPLGAFPRATFADLAAALHHRPVTVLDVRRDGERAAGHLPGSVHIPLHQLTDRLGEMPAGEVWVHCASGYRASIAASVLAAAGISVVAIDDDYANAVSVSTVTGA
jgi:hydroxyacylglutathione hydrolase